MHISHYFIATKTCHSYEFLLVFGPEPSPDSLQ